MNIYESAEDYLEMILMLQEEKGFARSVDIAASLGVTKPSVSFAMKKLRENGYITMGEDNYISLTEKGRAIALRVYERHKALTAFLMGLGVGAETARELKESLAAENLLADRTAGERQWYTSGDPAAFSAQAEVFLGHPIRAGSCFGEGGQGR